MRKLSTKTKKKAPKLYPNKETAWAYFMQSIEPSSKELDEAFPEYHPMWVIQSQREDATPERFKYLRESVLKISKEQCAAFLRLNKTTICRWESKKAKLPFSAFEALRLVAHSPHFKLSNAKWQGWFIDNNGRLVSPDRGKLSFTPHELSFIREVHTAKALYETENRQLKAEIEPLRSELAELRSATVVHGALQELKEIEAKIASLTHRIKNSTVVPINIKSKTTQTTMEAKNSMRNRPSFKIHQFEYDNPSAAITRLYKHVRSLSAGKYSPKSIYARKVASHHATRPKLRLVK